MTALRVPPTTARSLTHSPSPFFRSLIIRRIGSGDAAPAPGKYRRTTLNESALQHHEVYRPTPWDRERAVSDAGANPSARANRFQALVVATA